MMRQVMAGAAIALGAASFVFAQGAGHEAGAQATVFSPAAIRWQPGPASLPAGAKLAVLEGDPAKEGPFTMRLSLPDGYRIPPHVHPKAERLTVLSGTFLLGMGDRFDAKAMRPLPTGSYGYWPAGMKHFVWAEGDTVVQLHGVGPWQITYLDPKDDPQNAAH